MISDDRLFAHYHASLSECLSHLVNAIYNVIKSKDSLYNHSYNDHSYNDHSYNDHSYNDHGCNDLADSLV